MKILVLLCLSTFLYGQKVIKKDSIERETELKEFRVIANPGQKDDNAILATEVMTIKTLGKAACCNLSESFETNASVSVSYADAVTGSKQIQLLGLAGNYVQTNVENIPSIRGMKSTFGLNYLPGTWIKSIDLAKGTISVVNGYESMTGAINVELAKPDTSEVYYLNTYTNSQGRFEINQQGAHRDSSQIRWTATCIAGRRP
jgi:outer membrane receptor for ferrienterochelin and colicin